MSWWPAVAGLAAPLGAILGVIITVWAARRASRETTSVTLLGEIQDWTELRLKERDDRIDKLSAEIEKRDTRIDGLEKDVRGLRAEVDDLFRRYRSAIAYIGRLVEQLKRHVPPNEIERPPASIRPDLF